MIKTAGMYIVCRFFLLHSCINIKCFYYIAYKNMKGGCYV